MKHLKISLSVIREFADEEYIELAATALWLEEREREIIKIGVNQAIAAAFGEKN